MWGEGGGDSWDSGGGLLEDLWQSASCRPPNTGLLEDHQLQGSCHPPLGLIMAAHQQKWHDVWYFSHLAHQSESKNTWVQSQLLFPTLRMSLTYQ